MKKIISSLLACCLVFLTGNSVYAETNHGNSFYETYLKSNKEEIERLEGLGYSKEEIKELTEEEYEREKDDYGTVVSAQDTYYRIDESGVEQLTKKEAFKEIKEYEDKQESMITLRNDSYEDSEKTSWMKVTTTVTKYRDKVDDYPTGEFKFKHSFEWLNDKPLWRLTDVIAISHPEYFTPVQNSEFMRYKFDLYSRDYPYNKKIDTDSRTSDSADEKNSNGMAFKIDLLTEAKADNGDYGMVKDHRGYMHFKAELNDNSRTKGSVYGHYVHSLYKASNISIDITSKGISVSGPTATDKMTDTGVSFRLD